MINPKILRDNADIIEHSLKNRGSEIDTTFKELKDLDTLWRKKQQRAWKRLQALRNKSVPKGKPSDEERKTFKIICATQKIYKRGY